MPRQERDREQQGTGTPPAVARFYDTLRSGALSAAALAHGDADIGQECLLTPEEILDLARRVGITAGTSVLDIGSGTGGPACYLAQQLGCRLLGVDISAVGHAQALGRLAFYDHVVCQPLPAEEYQHFCQLWRFPGLETPQSYRAALQAAGFRILAHDVTSAYAVRFYTRLLTLYTERRTEFAAVRGPARYQEGLERLQMGQRFATAGLLGQLACIAEKPGG